MYVFEVSVFYAGEENEDSRPDAQYKVAAGSDVEARAKAIEIDQRIEEEILSAPRSIEERVAYCEIRRVCRLDE